VGRKEKRRPARISGGRHRLRKAATRYEPFQPGADRDRVLIHVDTELGAKDLLNNRMAYVAVSHGAYDAQMDR